MCKSYRSNVPGISTVQFLKTLVIKYLNSQEFIGSNDHDIDGGVTFYNQKLKRGEEILFSTPGNGNHIGIWNGGNGVTGSNNVTNKSNWSLKWHYNGTRPLWESGSDSLLDHRCRIE